MGCSRLKFFAVGVTSLQAAAIPGAEKSDGRKEGRRDSAEPA